MGRPKRTRRDINHREIVRDTRKLGAVVLDTADLGGKVLDILVCWKGRCIPVEIKAPGKRDDLTKGERECILELKTVGVEAIVAECVEDIEEAWTKEELSAGAVDIDDLHDLWVDE